MMNLFDPTFDVGDRIVSTCGSLYRGCHGVITAVGTTYDETEYSVTVTAPACAILSESQHRCTFRDSMMVRADADPGRDADRQCIDCLGCTLPKRGSL